MVAPSAISRLAPGGTPLRDGHPTKVTIGEDPDISFWERNVTPPGIDGGDAIETTTYHNSTWRTMLPRSLKTMTEMSVTGTYDPEVYTQMVSQINVNQTITVAFADGSTVAFYGYLKTFEPQENEEGEDPEAEFTIVPTNVDPTDSTTEEAPVYTAPN